MPVGQRGRAKRGLWLSFSLLTCGAVAAACQAPASESGAVLSAPIIGGELDTTHKGVVSLLKEVQGGFFPACSGTLLTQNLVLTAHHCVAALSSADGASVDCTRTTFEPTDKASTMLVSIEANVGREGLEPYEVSQVWVPDGDDSVCGRDIALLLLKGAGVPASLAKPIAPKLTGEVTRAQVLSAIGYGLQDPTDETGETAGHRMGVSDAQVYCAGSACSTDLIEDTEWIAESPVCSGDSGGPALNADGQVVGVTSRGDADCTLGIYSSVYAWRDFIIEKTFDAAESGHYLPPAWAGDPPPDFDPGIPTAGSGGTGGAGGSAGTGSGGTAGKAGSGGGSPIIAGGPSTTPGTGSPTVDPLGLECTGKCPGSYHCWSETGEPPGICVPECDANKACPESYSCNAEIGACVPTSAVKDRKLVQSSGCNLAAPGAAASGWWAVLLLALGWRGRARKGAWAKSGT